MWRGPAFVILLTSLEGADHDTRFRSVVTSYDYDAPLSEAGDPTEKLLAIRDVIKQVSLIELPPSQAVVLIMLAASACLGYDLFINCCSSTVSRYPFWTNATSNSQVCLWLCDPQEGTVLFQKMLF